MRPFRDHPVPERGKQVKRLLAEMYWDFRFDVGSIRRYGRHAPLRFQRIWFDPTECVRRTESFQTYRWAGRVMGGDWDLDSVPVEDHPIFRACRLHWEHGVPWAETGIYEWQLERIERLGAPIDGCSNREQIIERYDDLDRVFAEVRAEGRLRTRSELPGRLHRERGGIRINIGRRGEPIFCWAGHHRLAMARALRLERVPGQLHVIHPDALAVWRGRFTG